MMLQLTKEDWIDPERIEFLERLSIAETRIGFRSGTVIRVRLDIDEVITKLRTGAPKWPDRH